MSLGDAVTPIRTGTYRHTKSGKLYQVLGVARHTENHEWLVVYKPLYDHDFNHDFFTRPYDMFTGDVVIDGNRVQRFEYLND